MLLCSLLNLIEIGLEPVNLLKLKHKNAWPFIHLCVYLAVFVSLQDLFTAV